MSDCPYNLHLAPCSDVAQAGARIQQIYLFMGIIKHYSHIYYSYMETCKALSITVYTNSLCDTRVSHSCTLESTSSWTTVLVVSSTRTVCRSFSSSKPFSISCHNMLMMFPAAACHVHTNTLNCLHGSLANLSILLIIH